jgi:hypothetical protein
MTNSLQAHTKSDQQFQIRSELNFMPISLQTHTKAPSKLRFSDLKFALSTTIDSAKSPRMMGSDKIIEKNILVKTFILYFLTKNCTWKTITESSKKK